MIPSNCLSGWLVCLSAIIYCKEDALPCSFWITCLPEYWSHELWHCLLGGFFARFSVTRRWYLRLWNFVSLWGCRRRRGGWVAAAQEKAANEPVSPGGDGLYFSLGKCLTFLKNKKKHAFWRIADHFPYLFSLFLISRPFCPSARAYICFKVSYSCSFVIICVFYTQREKNEKSFELFNNTLFVGQFKL